MKNVLSFFIGNECIFGKNLRGVGPGLPIWSESIQLELACDGFTSIS